MTGGVLTETEHPTWPGVERRKEPNHLLRRMQRRLLIERILWASSLMVVLMLWLGPVLFPSAWAICVDDKPVAAVESRAVAADLVEAVRSSKLAQAGLPPGGAALAEKVTIRRVAPSEVRLVDSAAARKRLDAAVELEAERGVIYVNGLSVVALPDAREAEAMLQQIKQRMVSSLQHLETPPRFVQDVEVRSEPAREEIWADRKTAEALLVGDEMAEETASQTVTVRRGDTAGEIAIQHDTTVADLERLNPGVAWNRLRIGQQLRVGDAPSPVITVTAMGRVTETLSVPFQTSRRGSYRMYRGKTMMIRPGKTGREKVTYEVTLENGRVVGRRAIRREQIARPESQVVVVGTKPRPR